MSFPENLCQKLSRVAYYSTCMLSLLTTSLGAQLAQTASVPILQLTTPEARSAPTFRNVFGVLALDGGHVLVNDGVRRQLVVLDAKLSEPTVLLDTLAVGGPAYGNLPNPLIRHGADTIFFVDVASRSLQIITSSGKLGSVIALPKASDLSYLISSLAGSDARGNLYYRGTVPAARSVATSKTTFKIVQPADSAPILRANFETRMVDTIAKLKAQPPRSIFYGPEDSKGNSEQKIVINPMLAVDEWAMLSDGTIEIVRGQDYHIDVIEPSGKRFSAPKLPFDWKRITDEDKLALIDSARKAEEKKDADKRAQQAARKAQGAMIGGAATGNGARNFYPIEVSPPLTIDFVPLTEIADYYPPIRTNSALPDLDGNLWILPTTSAQSKGGELVYDVVNNQGVLTHRVRMPLGRSIAGFGRQGVVYMIARDSENNWFIERARVAKP